MVKVPRGQASFTLNENIHYNYGRIAGGSPPNEIMCDRLKEITQRVNMVMGRNYNTILMNVYKNNKDCFAAHQDNENGWVKGSSFGTLAFGCERPFVICEIATKNRERVLSAKKCDITRFCCPMVASKPSSERMPEHARPLKQRGSNKKNGAQARELEAMRGWWWFCLGLLNKQGFQRAVPKLKQVRFVTSPFGALSSSLFLAVQSS